jgi:thioredoxin-like negative regulator of GroEL
MAPAFAQFEQNNKATATIVDVDMDNKELVTKYQAYMTEQSIPFTVFLKDGKTVSTKLGSMTAEDLQQELDKASKS